MKLQNKRVWLMPNSVCLATGHSVALNLMFENKSDHQRFFKLWDKYLGGMTQVINYKITPTGWTVLFRTNPKNEIVSCYKNQRSLSKKAKSENELKEVARMISEHFRIFLSQFVRLSNARKGRKGTLVLESFKKYVLKDDADYNKFFKIITKSIGDPQPNAKYRANIVRYDDKNEMEEESVWKNAMKVYTGMACKVLKCMCLEYVNDSILRKFIDHPKNPFSPNSPP